MVMAGLGPSPILVPTIQAVPAGTASRIHAVGGCRRLARVAARAALGEYLFAAREYCLARGQVRLASWSVRKTMWFVLCRKKSAMAGVQDSVTFQYVEFSRATEISIGVVFWPPNNALKCRSQSSLYNPMFK